MLKINEEMDKYLSTISQKTEELKEINDNVFNVKTLPDINSKVRGDNFYAVDVHGILIRKNDFNNKRSPCGWTKEGEDEKFVNLHVQHSSNELDTKKYTIKYLKTKFATQFKAPRGVLNRFYDAIEKEMNGDE